MKNISLTPRLLLGFACIATGIILAVFFWEFRVFWFQGGPLGIALIGLGVLDLWESQRRTTNGTTRGLLQELRDDLVGPAHHNEPQHNGDPKTLGPNPTGTADSGIDDEEPPRRR